MTNLYFYAQAVVVVVVVVVVVNVDVVMKVFDRKETQYDDHRWDIQRVARNRNGNYAKGYQIGIMQNNSQQIRVILIHMNTASCVYLSNNFLLFYSWIEN